MSTLNFKPSPTQVLLAAAALYVFARSRAKATAQINGGQPTTNQQYALWQQLGLPQIANQLLTQTLLGGGAQPTNSGPAWQGNTPTTPSWWTVGYAGAPHAYESKPAADPITAAQFWGG